MFFIEILKAIAQGVVQGITEWLPVSSTGHIILLDAVWKMDASNAFFDVFSVIIQLGSILAVLVLFWGKLNPFSPKKSDDEKKATWVLWSKVMVAALPAAIVGLAMEVVFEVPDAPIVIANTLIAYGVAFIWMESRKDHKASINELSEISYKHALGIGAFQMLALIPGTSRSGSTILGATILGVSRTVAAEFSFFLAIPMMFGASAVRLAKYFLLDDYCAKCQEILDSENVANGLCKACDTAISHPTFSVGEWALLIIATVVAFVVSLLVIRGLMAFIKKYSFQPFGWYRIALGVVVLNVLYLFPNLLK